jgi:hypothetical protein
MNNNKRLLFYFLLVFYFFLSNISFSQVGFNNKIDSLINLITTQSISLLDRELSGDTSTIIGGTPYTITTRHYNSPSNPKAAQYIYEKFQSFGLSARYQNNNSTNINVLAVKPGIKYPNQYFIICSHYDDMPYYPANPLAPGADDNGSGTCGVIEAARILSNINLDYTIVFATFDEEEAGLLGSKAYSDSAYLHGDSIVGVINLDMISYDGNNDSKSFLVTNTNSSGFADEVISALRVYVPTLYPVKYFDNTANSDHASFWAHNWKAIMSIEDENDFTPYYHTPNDKFNTLNIPYYLKMARGAIAALACFAADYKMSFVHTPIASGTSTNTRTATVVISSRKKVNILSYAPRLYYKINSGPYSFVNANYNNLDTFKFNIPGQPIGTTVSYYFAAQDSLDQFVCTYPAGGRGISPPGTIAPLNTFSYEVEPYTTACTGNGTLAVAYPFNTLWHDCKTDMLYTASEVIASGGGNGNIMKIGFDVISAASQVMNGFSIKMQNSNLTTLSGFVQSKWTTVYTGTYTVTNTGIQYIDLQSPFHWDGISNLLIEICFDNTSFTASSTVKATTLSGMIWMQQLDNSEGCTFSAGSTQSGRPNLCMKIDLQSISVSNNSSKTPSKYSLSQNYPNPFNPITKIEYSLPKQGFVSIKIFDILGREVKILINEFKNPGYYSIDFNASELSSGVYYYKLESGEFTDIKRMTVIK